MAALDPRLQHALEKKRGSYEVRTRFLDDNGAPRYTNRLILEDSPYLLQHAHNPVNWYGWGDDAFAVAQAEDKPVFLSIGYSTCHWCHVMEEESFDNEDVAALLNEHFISIKVDREQRPDIDDIYMTAVQLITQGGGWPMSSFLTPEGKPFFGGTYYPRDQFMQLLGSVAQAWRADRQNIEHNSEQLQQAMQQQLITRAASERAGADKLRHVVQVLRATEDHLCGGFGEAPKFPNESSLLFMLDQIERNGQPLAKEPLWLQLQRALYAMLQGGIYDQVGGGFHRYATDRNWLVPHFEKMLYNQAQLTRVYARAWRLCGFPEYRRIAEETLDYVLREMRDAGGGFYSATDADSEGEEGRFFVWHWDELTALLSSEELQLAQYIYGVTESGNFEGANILFLPQPLFDAARHLGIRYEQLREQLTALKSKLYDARQQRVAPLRDDKVITEWNGMMITGLAEAGRLFGREDYLQAAISAAEFIHQHSRDQDQLLLRTNLGGHASVAATLEDYSNWLEAMLALYDASGDELWLQRAEDAERDMLKLFGDSEQGGFYNSRADSDGPLIIRSQSAHDGATPAGNSVALVAQVALNRRAYQPEREARIEQHWLRFSGLVDLIPAGLCYLLTGIAEQLEPAPTSPRYAAGGKLRIEGRLQRGAGDEHALEVKLTMAPGWHINASQCPAGQTPTTLTTAADSPWQLTTNEWPEPTRETLGFSNEELPLYQGTVTITGRASAEGGPDRPPLALELTVQPCSETECLQPETVTLLLHPH